jgi:hypothetical protein
MDMRLELLDSDEFTRCLMPNIFRTNWFERTLHHEGLRIRIASRCRNCGTTIIGSVAESLLQDEEQHVRACAQISHVNLEAGTLRVKLVRK